MFRDPPASPTRVGGATRPLKCPLRGRIESLAPGARGLGWQKSGPVKVFCPAFLQKSGRGPGAEPMDARRSARNTPMLKEAQEGVKGEPSPGVPPLRAAPPPAVPAPPWGWRWTKERVVEDADPYRAGAATRGLRSSRRPGGGGTPPLQGLAERGKAGGDRDGGTSGTPSPTGLVRRRGAGGNLRQGSSRTPTPTGRGKTEPRAAEFTVCGTRRRKW